MAHDQANEAELEAEALSGNLIEVDVFAELVAEEYSCVRARLLAIPTKLAPVLLGLEDASHARELVEQCVFEAMEELAADSD